MNNLLDDSQVEALKSLCAGPDDPSAFKELLELFVNQGKQCVELLEKDVSELAYENLYASAHKLKGSSGSMGASFLSYLCAHLEEAAKDKNELEAKRLVKEIKKIFELSISCLRTHIVS